MKKLNVDKTESFNWAIVIDEKDLRRLDETLKSTLKSSDEEETINILYEMTCSDGSKIETDDINEVVSEENSKDQGIEHIEIHAENPTSSNKISISFGSKHSYSKEQVTYSITGDSRDWVYLTYSKIEERIKTLKQWYSILKNIDFGLTFLLIFVFILFLLPPIDIDPLNKFPESVGIIIMILFFILLLLFMRFLQSGVNYLFPSVVFRIGDGIERHDKLINLKTKLFWGVFITFMISMATGIVLKIM